MACFTPLPWGEISAMPTVNPNAEPHGHQQHQARADLALVQVDQRRDRLGASTDPPPPPECVYAFRDKHVGIAANLPVEVRPPGQAIVRPPNGGGVLTKPGEPRRDPQRRWPVLRERGGPQLIHFGLHRHLGVATSTDNTCQVVDVQPSRTVAPAASPASPTFAAAFA